MRLLYVHERYGALGGAEANVLATATALHERGHALGLAHGAPTGRELPAWDAAFPERFPLDPDDSGRSLEHAAAAFRPDAIFLHKLSDLGALTALAAGAAPVVRMVHDHDLYCIRGYKYNPLSRRICSRAASAFCVFPCGGTIARRPAGPLPFTWVSFRAKQRELALNRRFTRLVVASEFMRAELIRNGFPAERIEIHAPVPRSAEDGFASTFDASNRLVYAGQIIRGKGVDVLLESLARVRVPFECLIVGEGSHRAYCEALSRRLGLEDRVRFTGFVPQAEIARFYRTASVAVMSSLWPEPFGATGLEAMRCGLPVVAFDAGGIREWLIDGWNGRLVPWMDRTRYAAAIESLLRDKTLAQQMGRKGRAWVGERFGFPQYIAGLEELFGRINRTGPAAAVPALP